MKYQKIINLLDETINQSAKFITRNWVEINDESRRNNENSDIKFITSMIRLNLCDYGMYTYMLKQLWQFQTQQLLNNTN